MAGVNVSNFIVPEVPTRESAGLVRLGETMQRNKEWDYRLRKDQEADQWRKLNLVQELTDLSKHQTGSDVANALGHKLMTDVYQKYTQNVDKMDGKELQYNIQKDMSGIITGMEGTKNELANLDKQAGALKTTYPGLDVGKLYKDAREDIIHRRLRNDLGGFNNEIEVQPSQFNLNDPEFLSNYVTDLKGLRTFVTSPQTGEKRQAFKGTRTDHTEFNGNITPWLRENFDRSKLSGGMLSWKDPDPKLELKSSKVGDLNVVDEDVYKLFNESFPLETKYLARQQFQDYDKFDARKKQLAERSALDSYLRTVDQNQYYPSQVKTPSASLLKFYSGGGNEKKQQEPIDLRDPIYKDVDGGKDITPLMQGVKVTGLPNGTTLLARKVIFDPTTKKVTYQEYTDKKDEQGNFPEKTVNLTTFLQNIKTNNPGIDMKFLEGLWNPIVNDKQEKTPTKAAPKKDPLGILD